MLLIINENPNIKVIFCWTTENVADSKRYHEVTIDDVIQNKIKYENDGYKIRIPVSELPAQVM